MTDASIRLAKIARARERDHALLALLQNTLQLPMVQLVGGITAVELLQRYPAHNPIIGDQLGNAIEMGVALTAIMSAVPQGMQWPDVNLLTLLK